MFGIFSYFLDGMSGGENAYAMDMHGVEQKEGRKRSGWEEMILRPAIPLAWLHSAASVLHPCGSSETEGCRLTTAMRRKKP